MQSFQAVQHMMANMAVEVEAARCSDVCGRKERGLRTVEDLAKESAMAKSTLRKWRWG